MYIKVGVRRLKRGVMDKTKISKLHFVVKTILNEVIRICENHSIPYFLIAGSALGAIRHQGIIPWDDDIDIGMLRKDYDKFLIVCEEELDNRYFLQNSLTEPLVPFTFSKIRANGTSLKEYSTKSLDIHHGIFIDIFPFDNIPNNKILMYKQYITLCYYSMFRQSCTKEMCLSSKSKFRKYLRLLFYYIQKITSKKINDNLEYKCMTKYNHNSGKKVCSFDLYGINNYLKKSIMDIEDIFPIYYTKFCEYEVPVPREYDKYLKNVYGDYMKYPSLEMRKPHHLDIDIEFGDFIKQ